MQLDLFRSLWGWPAGPGADWARCGAECRENGFVGVETRLPADPFARRALKSALAEQGLDYIAVVFTGGDVIPDQSWAPAQHCDRLAAAIDGAGQLGARFVNVLAGNDRWPLAMQVDFFGRAQALADAAGIMCSFEIHRATSLYSPWLTLDLIAQVPQLRFTADLSHWVVVSERLLNDPADDLSPFLNRVHHVQARVGYDQGPQVPHPAAPEYADALAWHQAMWERVWAAQHARGQAVTTLTPEFGPDGYTHLLPFTRAPVADIWDLNRWMAQTSRTQFTAWSQMA
ncbi:TIM barrel protein [Novosphingobium sp.]|uniref:sugar phosphate isomerase/epimerase family protein n=1 Tax=Novosphingobium sp. TaxID=1874826 RepID=UPI0033410863